MHELKAAVSAASASEPLAWRDDRVVQRVLSAVPDEPVRAALERLVAELSKQHGALCGPPHCCLRALPGAAPASDLQQMLLGGMDRRRDPLARGHA